MNAGKRRGSAVRMATSVERLGAFVTRASYERLSHDARDALKIRILDAIACSIGALGAEPMNTIRRLTDEFGGSKLCSLIGGGKTAPDRAAFHNGALIRYLDFNDSYLAKKETCHPSDNLAPILAAAEYADRDGRTLLTALAVAYQVQCRLSDVAPVRDKGFDHTTQGAYAVAAGVANALGLSGDRAANAIAISGTAYNALRVTRTGVLSNWKGLAYPNTALGATHAAFLAMRGITGPPEVFEGNKGFMDAIAGHFEIDWSAEDLERVTRTILKKFNAEVHSQSALEGILELKADYAIRPEDVREVNVEIFDVAYNIIGGGEEGEKKSVETKEQADHSLPYLLAVALLDDAVMPAQYAEARIRRRDVQDLLRKIVIRPKKEFSDRFPDEMPCQITVTLRNGRDLVKQKSAYEGFYTQPMRWETVEKKFEHLGGERLTASLRRKIVGTIADLETHRVGDLLRLLRRVHSS